MTNLDNFEKKIEVFISTSIDKFISEKNLPTSIGIYCCPWAGWLTTNFNISKTLEETENNCLDFEFVQFGNLELQEWQEEYEKDTPTFETKDVIINHNHDSGDEKFNEIFFSFLEPISAIIKQKYQQNILLQMLDSGLYKVL